MFVRKLNILGSHHLLMTSFLCGPSKMNSNSVGLLTYVSWAKTIKIITKRNVKINLSTLPKEITRIPLGRGMDFPQLCRWYKHLLKSTDQLLKSQRQIYHRLLIWEIFLITTLLGRSVINKNAAAALLTQLYK